MPARAIALHLDRDGFVAQAQGVSLCESSSQPDAAPTLAWDERALIDWEGGIRAAVHAWLGPERPSPGSQELAAALARAEGSARASKPASFLELMRRVYLSLAQDLAFAPRQLDLLELESRLRAFFPRPGVAQRLQALRRAGMALAWVQESGSAIAAGWRAQIGVPFEHIVELGPVHRCLSETAARAIDQQAQAFKSKIVLVRGPGRSLPDDRFSKNSSAGLAGEVSWPDTGSCVPEWAGLSEHWQRRVCELLDD